MKAEKGRRLAALAALGTAWIASGQVFRYPGAVRDAVTGVFPAFAALAYPKAYVLFAPFFQFADHFTLLSLRQHAALILFANAVWALARLAAPAGSGSLFRRALRETGAWLLLNVAYAAAAAAIVLVPRPMARLALSGPDLLAVDFHSHTSYSWDARKSFTPEENLEWHARAGFQAAFVTDHNTVNGATEARELLLENDTPPGLVPMRGEEVSLYRSHWILLGNEVLVPNTPYDRGPEGLHDFLADQRKAGGRIVIMSLPEYWLHWPTGLEQFADWGADGFEVVNSPPLALDMPPSFRKRVADFCRERNLVMTGVTDNHGWGSTAYVWSVVRIPGWRELAPEDLERAVISELQADRYRAVQVLIRVRAEAPERAVWLAFDPLRQAWEAARSLPASQAAVSVAWLWLPFLVSAVRRRRLQSEQEP